MNYKQVFDILSDIAFNYSDLLCDGYGVTVNVGIDWNGDPKIYTTNHPNIRLLQQFDLDGDDDDTLDLITNLILDHLT